MGHKENGNQELCCTFELWRWSSTSNFNNPFGLCLIEIKEKKINTHLYIWVLDMSPTFVQKDTTVLKLDAHHFWESLEAVYHSEKSTTFSKKIWVAGLYTLQTNRVINKKKWHDWHFSKFVSNLMNSFAIVCLLWIYIGTAESQCLWIESWTPIFFLSLEFRFLFCFFDKM